MAQITALQITDVSVGEGAEAVAGKEVSVHYTGWLYDEKAAAHHGKKFDSSRDHGEPFAFRLGARAYVSPLAGIDAERIELGDDAWIAGYAYVTDRDNLVLWSLGWITDKFPAITPLFTSDEEAGQWWWDDEARAYQRRA